MEAPRGSKGELSSLCPLAPPAPNQHDGAKRSPNHPYLTWCLVKRNVQLYNNIFHKVKIFKTAFDSYLI